MRVVVSVLDSGIKGRDIEEIFEYLKNIDERFSTYKNSSEMTQINLGFIKEKDYSSEMQEVFKLSEMTKKETHGYFNIEKKERIDPSGLVKGYAISKSADILRKKGFTNFYIEIAGDIEVSGLNEEGKKWRVGIQNPFEITEIVKVVGLTNCGIATSGNYRRGIHIYNPKTKKNADEIAGMTVIAKNAYDADRFATAAFAMGQKGIEFLEKIKNAEGYMITKDKRGHFTTGFERFTIN